MFCISDSSGEVMYFFHFCGNILKRFYIVDSDLWLKNTKVTYCCFSMPPLSVFLYYCQWHL